MTKASPILSSFNGGEYSPLMEGRTDYAKYPKGLRKAVNFLATTQGPAVRRGGMRFVSEVKNSATRPWLIKFQFNVEQSYALEFGEGYIRFYTNHGQVINGAVPYEIASPYAVADLTNTDGTLALHYAQSADVLYLFHAKYPPQKLSRLGALNWTIAPVDFKGGPFDDENLDKNLYISVATGLGSVQSNFDIFTADHVGTLLYLESKDYSAVPPWQPGKVIAATDQNPYGTLRRVDQRVYMCVTDLTNTEDLPIITGTQTLTHTSGNAWDGDGNPVASVAYKAGVEWQFMHPGYVVLKITDIINARAAHVTIQSDWDVPADVISDDIPGGTWRWAVSRWSNAKGWPDLVTFFRNRLVAARSADQAIDFSVVSDYLNFQDKEFGDVTSDMAISATVAADQEYNALAWMSSADQLLIGGAGGEFACGEQTTNDVFGPDNIKISKQSGYGSRGIDAIAAGNTILYVQKGGRQLMEMQFNIQSNNFDSDDKSVPAEHLMVGGLVQTAFQKETDSILWALRSDGALLSFAYNPKQDVYAWMPQQIGGTGVVVESILVLPAPTLDRSELWAIVRRTIGGQTRRYVEYMERPYRIGDTQASGFYVDAGLTYSGAPATTISGLNHLEGQTVDILSDGAVQPQQVVTAGAVTLHSPGSVVNVGLPCPCRLVTERLEAGATDGTAQGKTKRIMKVVFRFDNSLGGEFGPQDGPYDDLFTRSGNDPMDAPPPLLTGDTERLSFPSGYDFNGVIEYRNDQPVPVTVVAIMPQVVTQDS
ncbi:MULTISPECIES: hypothetical protein [unclassified Achromobacter]|uniref:hypothetical protein n=1 Tax=unclassified Achromobacter TaxID=2626865 RepID=UPI000B515409|nr:MULTISPECIES: hypothetical protein [unclassified Achromobacter]OWT68090.1 hypothetical protein CEY05_29080 [Achromobacter sp. HZ34]OWT69927.1 hypothetical protein CEY04_27910 [Achromobacter sp. HZ28]